MTLSTWLSPGNIVRYMLLSYVPMFLLFYSKFDFPIVVKPLKLTPNLTQADDTLNLALTDDRHLL